SRDFLSHVQELSQGSVRHQQGLRPLVRAPPPVLVDFGDLNAGSISHCHVSPSGLMRSGIPLTMKYTSSAALAITSLALPAQSRNLLPSTVSGTTPEPTSLVTTITAAPGRPRAPSRSSSAHACAALSSNRSSARRRL